MELIDYRTTEDSFAYLKGLSAYQQERGQFPFNRRYQVVKSLLGREDLANNHPSLHTSLVVVSSEPAAISAVSSLVPDGSTIRVISRRVTKAQITFLERVMIQNNSHVLPLQCLTARQAFTSLTLRWNRLNFSQSLIQCKCSCKEETREILRCSL